MSNNEQYLLTLNNALAANTFVSISLTNYNGAIANLKKVVVKKVRIKNEDKLSFTYRYSTNDIVKNYGSAQALVILQEYISHDAFKHAMLCTLTANTVLEQITTTKSTLKNHMPTHAQLPSLLHDIPKNRHIVAEGKPYLHQLKITNEHGVVNKNAEDKFKQINHYIELLSPLIKNLPTTDNFTVMDMGAGKGYLTFALYDYLTNVLHTNTTVTGVEYRPDLVTLCNSIAQHAKFEGLRFIQGAINDISVPQIHLLIALHACDIATDEAIYKGIKANANLIVVAPCCHKQIRKELLLHKAKNEFDFMLKHGIFMERQAEMLTDSLRALLLEYYGYSTKIVEFIAGEHTPKNIMIIAQKKAKTPEQKQALLIKINDTKVYFGIRIHYLEKLMQDNP